MVVYAITGATGDVGYLCCKKLVEQEGILFLFESFIDFLIFI